VDYDTLTGIPAFSPSHDDRTGAGGEKGVEVRDLGKDKHWLRIGEISNHILFIETGLIKSYTEIGKKELIIWFHREFDAVIGVKSFFKWVPSDIAIKTMEPTRISYA